MKTFVVLSLLIASAAPAQNNRSAVSLSGNDDALALIAHGERRAAFSAAAERRLFA